MKRAAGFSCGLCAAFARVARWFRRKTESPPAPAADQAGRSALLRAEIARLEAEIDAVYSRIARGQGAQPDAAALVAEARRLKEALRMRRRSILGLGPAGGGEGRPPDLAEIDAAMAAIRERRSAASGFDDDDGPLEFESLLDPPT